MTWIWCPWIQLGFHPQAEPSDAHINNNVCIKKDVLLTFTLPKKSEKAGSSIKLFYIVLMNSSTFTSPWLLFLVCFMYFDIRKLLKIRLIRKSFLWIPTLPLTVSPLCNLATGALCSRFSSICQAMTVMLPTRSFSADLTNQATTKSVQCPEKPKCNLQFVTRKSPIVLCVPVTWESGAVCGACPAAAPSRRTWQSRACTSVT